MYDKECQGPDYVDFVKPAKKKRTHPKREPLPTTAREREAEPHEEEIIRAADEHNFKHHSKGEVKS